MLVIVWYYVGFVVFLVRCVDWWCLCGSVFFVCVLFLLFFCMKFVR